MAFWGGELCISKFLYKKTARRPLILLDFQGNFMQAIKYQAEIGAEGEIILPRLRLSQGTSVEVTVLVPEIDSEQLPLPSDPVQQAREFYDTKLRLEMEERYNGQYIAIHPESQTYSVQQGYGKAFRALRAQQPLSPIIVHNIGFSSSGLKARLRGEQPQ